MAADTITVSEVLELLDGQFAELASSVSDGGYVLWLGSGISRGRVIGLDGVIAKLLEYLRGRVTSAVDCRFRTALSEILDIAKLPDGDRATIDFAVPVKDWPVFGALIDTLWNSYAEVLSVDVSGEEPDFLLWDALDFPNTFAAQKPLQLDKHRQPAPSTVRRWLNDRGAPGLRKLRSMTSMSSRVPRSLRLAPSIHRQMHRCAMAYWAERGTSIGEAYARLCTRVARINRWLDRHERRVLAVPSKESFRLHVRLTECWETVAAKYGPKEADKRFKACGKGLVSNRPLLLGAMDHTILDCFAVINAKGWRLLGRPTLTVLIDVHSRCIVGWVLSFEPPSLFAVMECIKRANRPKLHLRERYPDNPELEDIFGKFDEIVVDNGWEFSGTSFEAAMTDIGTTVRWAPTRSPTYKAVVERFFGTLNSMLNRKLPGATFPIAQLRAWELDPRKDAVLTLDQLEKLIWATISTYHLHQHRTLCSGLSPGIAFACGFTRSAGLVVTNRARA